MLLLRFILGRKNYLICTNGCRRLCLFTLLLWSALSGDDVWASRRLAGKAQRVANVSTSNSWRERDLCDVHMWKLLPVTLRLAITRLLESEEWSPQQESCSTSNAAGRSRQLKVSRTKRGTMNEEACGTISRAGRNRRRLTDARPIGQLKDKFWWGHILSSQVCNS